MQGLVGQHMIPEDFNPDITVSKFIGSSTHLVTLTE